MDVPLRIAAAVLLPIQSEVMFTPGALRSTHEPKFEKEANASVMDVAPTVIADGSLAGENVHALTLLFPAATT
jgi:hypothetical protein